MQLKRRIYILTMKLAMYIAVILMCSIFAAIIGYVLFRGLPNISWEFLSASPSYLREEIGILPYIVNTSYLVLGTLLLVIPIGVGAAIYLTEYAVNKKFVLLIEYAAETLSWIPSILYGLVGMLVFCRFAGLDTSIMAGSLTLVIINLPIIMRTAQESLKTVPDSYREGALGLGAGKWRTIRTLVIPNCIDGVITGTILSVGRIVGESAALMFTAGTAHTLNGVIQGFRSSGGSLTVALYVYAKERGEFDVSFGIAAILVIFILLINIVTNKVSSHYLKRRNNVSDN